MKQTDIKQPDGSIKTGIFTHRSKKAGTRYMVIHNLINGENNPIGKYFMDKQDAIKFMSA